MLLIPKTVHRIWFGPRPIPEVCEEYADSWRDHGYKVRTWTEANLPPLRNRAIYEHPDVGRNPGGQPPDIARWVQQADVVSYELVWRFGGIYVNTDMECLRPLDDLLDGVECFAGIEQEDFLGSAIMGATPRHPFFDVLLDMLPIRWAAMPSRNMEAVTGPHLLTAVRDEFPDAITPFPASRFYPFLYSEMERERDEFPDAYTKHHWHHQGVPEWSR